MIDRESLCASTSNNGESLVIRQKTTQLRRQERKEQMPQTIEGQKKFFGLPVSSDVTKVNVASYLLGCLASVMFLVFLNASQVYPLFRLHNSFKPFVITDILRVKKIGDIVGTLGFADVHPPLQNKLTVRNYFRL